MPYPKLDDEQKMRIDVRISEFGDPDLFHALKRELDGLSPGRRGKRIRELLMKGVAQGSGGSERNREPATARAAPTLTNAPIVRPTSRKPEARPAKDPAGGTGGVAVEASQTEPTVEQQVNALDGFDIDYSFG